MNLMISTLVDLIGQHHNASIVHVLFSFNNRWCSVRNGQVLGSGTTLTVEPARGDEALVETALPVVELKVAPEEELPLCRCDCVMTNDTAWCSRY